MKSALALMLSLLLLLSLGGCGGESAPEKAEAEDKSAAAAPAAAPKETEAEAEAAGGFAYEVTGCITRTWVNSIETPWVQTVVEITNTGGENVYLSSGAYDLEDENGKLVASHDYVSAYPEVLAPGEKGYMYEETMLDAEPEGSLKAIPRVQVDECKVDLIRYPVTETELSPYTYGGVQCMGRVENTTDQPGQTVMVVCILYDAEGSCLGLMNTILMDELAPGAKVGFEMSGISLPEDVQIEDVAETEFFAYPMQFNF